MTDLLTKGLAREKVFKTLERIWLKPIENWIICEVNPTWKMRDPKKQVRWLITNHKWYEENHARITRSFILMIQWLAPSWSEWKGWT